MTASTTAFRGEPGLAPYVASKHAVLGLMRTASIEAAAHGIRVNAVSPGAIDTPMTRVGLAATFSSDEDGQRFLEGVAEAIPLKRIATPGDIANTLMFLISDDSAFTTGANYVVDGGATEAPSIW